MSNKYVFYHIYLCDKVNTIVEEQLNKLIDSKLIENAELNIIISGEDPYNSKIILGEKNLYWINKFAKVWYSGGNHYELPTLQQLYDHAKIHDGNYLYMHTKGCSRINDADNPKAVFGPYIGNYSYKNVENWRHIMEHFNIEHWKECNDALDEGYDLCGCNYMKLNHLGNGPLGHYSGNFWWAKSDFIKKLRDPRTLSGDRLSYEFWIGTIKHKAMCLYPLPEKIEEHNRCLVYTDPKDYINIIIKTEYHN